MTQYENVTIDPTVTNGSQLAANINSWRKAALTLHSGVERPSYASAGTMWISTASSPWKLCVYDGTDDVVIGELKPDSHDFVSAGGTDYTNDLMASGDAAEARDKLGAVAKSGDTVTGEIKASNDRNFRMMNGDRGVFWHLNSEDLYLMITNSGDQTGGWNNTRALRVRLSDGFVWLDRAKSNTNFGVGGATVSTDGNINGSIWGNWGNNWAYTAISNRIEDRGYWRTQDYTTDRGAGAVGSYAFAKPVNGTLNPSNMVAGSALRWSSSRFGASGGSLPGTWRCMGAGSDSGSATLFLRVS